MRPVSAIVVVACLLSGVPCSGAAPPPSDASATSGVQEAVALSPAAAEEILASAEAALYLPAEGRLRWLSPRGAPAVRVPNGVALPDETLAGFVASLDRDLPGFRHDSVGPYLLKVPVERSPEASLRVPAAPDVQAAGVPFREGFEGNLSAWTLSNDTLDLFDWGITTCQARSGSHAADAVRGGSFLSCADPYPASANLSMLHTPCEGLAGASAAWLDVWLTAALDGSDALLFFYQSDSDEKQYGYSFTGTWTGWTHVVLNLKQWYRIGDVTALGCPRLMVSFRSAAGTKTGFGARIDDLTIGTDTPSFLHVAVTATPASGPPPLAVSFSGSVAGSSGGEAYQWTFDDAANTTATTKNASFTYTAEGTYNVRFRVIDSPGTRGYAYVTIPVTSAACSLSCSASAPSSGTAGTPLSFQASASASGCTGAPSYTWSFGYQGQTSTQQNPSFAYPAAGTYTWTMSATLPGASTCTKTGTITISGSAGPAIPGDCNGDGKITVDELQRAINMALAVSAPACGADTNGDGKVSDDELLRILTAFLRQLSGTETQVASQTIGATGGTVTGNGFTLTVPPGAFASGTTLALYDDGPGQRREGDFSNTFTIRGLPDGLKADLVVEIDLPGNLPPLGPGEKYYISVDTQVFNRKLPDDQANSVRPLPIEATLTGTMLRATIPAGWPLPGSSPSPLAARTQGAAQLVVATSLNTVKINAGVKARYETDHFYALVLPTKRAGAESILLTLEVSFDKLTTGFGFSFGCRIDPPTSSFQKIFVDATPLGVNKDGNEPAYGYHENKSDPCGRNKYFATDYLVITTSYPASSKPVQATCGHELFHLLQNIYSPGDANLWLKEASSVWFETALGFTCPDVPSKNVTFAWNGLFNSRNSAVALDPWTFYRDKNRMMKHGYGGYFVLRDKALASGASDPFVRVLWDGIRKGSSEIDALQAALGSNLAEYWTRFSKSYFAASPTRECFPSYNSGDWDQVKIWDEKALPKSLSLQAYPLSSKSWGLDVSRFHTAEKVKGKISVEGLVDNQTVFLYSVKDRAFVSDLTKAKPELEIEDFNSYGGTLGTGWGTYFVLIFVDTNLPTGDPNAQAPTNTVTMKVVGATAMANSELDLRAQMNTNDTACQAVTKYFDKPGLWIEHIPTYAALDGKVTFRYDGPSFSYQGTYHVEGTGTFLQDKLSIQGAWTRVWVQTDGSKTITQNDSVTFTGEGGFIFGGAIWGPGPLKAKYSIAQVIDDSTTHEHKEATCSGSIDNSLSQVWDFKKKDP